MTTPGAREPNDGNPSDPLEGWTDTRVPMRQWMFALYGYGTLFCLLFPILNREGLGAVMWVACHLLIFVPLTLPFNCKQLLSSVLGGVMACGCFLWPAIRYGMHLPFLCESFMVGATLGACVPIFYNAKDERKRAAIGIYATVCLSVAGFFLYVVNFG